MDTQTFNHLQKRSRKGFVIATLSVAFILFFLGLFCGILLLGRAFIQEGRSTILMKISLNDGFQQTQLNLLQRELSQNPGIESISFISKEQALKKYISQTGDKDVLKLTGGINPLLASFDVKLKNTYIHSDSIKKMRNNLKKNILISEVNYPAEIIADVDKNMTYFWLLALVVAGISVFLTIYLVINTLRLAIFAQRLNIRTMQLIGATQSFIRKPFVRKGIMQGLLAGLIASLALGILFLGISLQLFSTHSGHSSVSYVEFFALLVGIVLFGGLLGYVGSYRAVNRFLYQPLDELMMES